MNIESGAKIKNYHIIELIGRGGMAEVYKVEDTQRGATLAMKVLREDLAEDRIFLRRFQREAQNLAKLQHPNIVRFYGLEQEGRLALMLMDYIEGTTLRGIIFDAGKPLSEQTAIRYLEPICKALHYAHQKGIVHCDIKPGNILVDKHGDVYLTDFGIARMADAATATMVGIGTPAYMAPELIKGLDPTPKSDIYSLGIVLYEMLTGGERPFTGEHAKTTGSTADKVRWEQINMAPPDPRRYNKSISPIMAEAIQTCLEKNQKKRFSSSLALLEKIKKPQEKIQPKLKKVKKSPTKKSSKPRKAVERKRWIVWARIGALGAAGIFILLQSGIIGPSEPIVISEPTEAIMVVETQEEIQSTPTSEPTATPQPSPNEICMIAYSSDEDGDDEIYLIHADGSNKRQLTFNNVYDGLPAWSPDGAKLAYLSSAGNERWKQDIFILDIKTENITQFTFDNSNEGSLNWSPDSSRVVYISNHEIFAKDIEDNNKIQYTFNNTFEENPTFSRDGQWISYTAGGDYRYDLFIIDSNGDNFKSLTSNNVSDGSVSWAPDNTHIAYDSYHFGYEKSMIFTMNIDNRSRTLLTSGNNSDFNPAISPDGKQIAYYSLRQESFGVYVMDFNGENQKKLFEKDGRGGIRYPIWTEEGNFIVFLDSNTLYFLDPKNGLVNQLDFKGEVWEYSLSAGCK